MKEPNNVAEIPLLNSTVGTPGPKKEATPDSGE